LATAGEYRTAFDAHPNYYDSMVESEFPGKRLADLPEKSLYALVYVGQILQQSLGGIRYGCDPYGLNSHDCAACIIKNPSRYDETPLDPTDGPQLGDVEFNEGFIGLQCNYHPDLRLLGFIELLLRITTNSGNPAPIVFSKEMFFDFWGKQ